MLNNICLCALRSRLSYVLTFMKTEVCIICKIFDVWIRVRSKRIRQKREKSEDDCWEKCFFGHRCCSTCIGVGCMIEKCPRVILCLLLITINLKWNLLFCTWLRVTCRLTVLMTKSIVLSVWLNWLFFLQNPLRDCIWNCTTNSGDSEKSTRLVRLITDL